MKVLNKIYFITLLAVTDWSHAQDREGYTGAAPSGAAFLLYNTDVWSSAMGNLKSIGMTNAFSLFSNLAKLSYQEDGLQHDISLSYSPVLPDHASDMNIFSAASNNLFVTGRGKENYIGLGFQYFSMGSVDLLDWIKVNYPQDHEMYYNSLPDTTVWDRTSTANSQFSKIYLRHPVFQEYPVVGVSWEQANDYCKWRTDRVNEQMLRDVLKVSGDGQEPFKIEDYLNGKNKSKEYTGGDMSETKITMEMEDGLLTQPYRLPTEAEWEYAAASLIANNEGYHTRKNIDVRSSKKSTKGLIMMNYKQGKGNNMGTAGYLNNGADITALVRSYEPNAFGLYNMLGNTNEWVADVYKENTYNSNEDLSPAVGFANETDLDGVAGSLKPSFEEFMDHNGDAGVLNNEYEAIVMQDSIDEKLYGISTLASNQSRVIKGGSWNDRIQWVNPSARRYMDQKTSSAMIGFRCAMTMTGSPEVISNNIKRASKKHFQAKGRRK